MSTTTPNEHSVSQFGGLKVLDKETAKDLSNVLPVAGGFMEYLYALEKDFLKYVHGCYGCNKIETDSSSSNSRLQACPPANPNEQPVELNRTSFFWGLLLIWVLAVLFSSYFFN